MKQRIRFASATILALGLAACGQQSGGAVAEVPAAATATANADGSMAGMDHGDMATNTAPYDAQFIDSMIEHHNGAIAMAQQALEQSERPEIKQLAQNIIASQQQETTQMTAWRAQWYPDLAPTGGMAMDMGEMEISDDAATPYDQRFIRAMISHHQGAVMMAKDAQAKAEHAELRQLAAEIIEAQEAEIVQMEQWMEEWFGGGS
jgi:uncharacterized protein (DUF305 family)